MTSSVRCSTRVALTLLASMNLACLGPNPLLEAGESASSESKGDGDGDPASETATTGDGDGDGDTNGDGDGEPDTGTNTEDSGCSDGMQNGDETDIDCGGSCSPCDDGDACLAPEDCASMICTEGSCAAPSCSDEIKNGTEIDVDCGGDCTFCAHSPLYAELDSFEASSARFPRVEMFGDLGFALVYFGDPGARVAWFDESGVSEDTEVVLSPEIPVSSNGALYFAVDAEANDEHVHALQPGLGPMSMSNDLFLVRRSPAEQLALEIVNDPSNTLSSGDVTVSGTIATIGWIESGTAWLRRFDYSIGDGSWSDVSPLAGEEANTAIGGISLSRNASGTIGVSWVRCDGPCEVVARRFADGSWLDDEPVVVHTEPMGFLFLPRIALLDDDSAFIAWWVPGGDNGSTLQAGMLTSQFFGDGEPWTIQAGLPLSEPFGVAPLSDGSVAIGWADREAGSIHLSRYVGPSTFKNPNYGDESPWDGLDTPRDVALASQGNHLVVVWAATVNDVDQIQGQVLSF